jgi:hypothetical protein
MPASLDPFDGTRLGYAGPGDKRKRIGLEMTYPMQAADGPSIVAAEKRWVCVTEPLQSGFQ